MTAENVSLKDEPGPHEETPLATGGAYVRLTVSDTGVGMDDETRKRAFEPFFTTKAPGEGTGLGLSMVFGAIRSHGGRVELESEQGVGTSVSILLPAALAQDRSMPATPRQPAPSRAGRVLLVDDEEAVLNLGKEMLERLGYDVVTVSNGLAAVEFYEAKATEVDLVMLDLSMPVMDGAQAFERLRAIDPDVTVLICSGHFADERVAAIMKGGAVGHLQKPYTMQDLSTQVDDAMCSR
jgi:CheY-like chemotaxis protein